MSEWLSLFRVVLDNLMLRNGKGTSLGALLGVMLSGVVNLFNPVFQKFKIIDIEKLATYHFIAFGIIVMNIPWFKKKQSFSPRIEEALHLIELEEKNGMNEIQVALLRKEVINAAIANIRENPTPQNEPVSEVVSTANENMKG
ncbi:hypothetical protein [Priestia megaterium]